jgi:septal ring-binding cell division protein DamX
VKKIVYPLIWLAVTAAAVLIASAAVSSVRDQVTDTPTAMLPPTTIAISSTEELPVDPVQSETPVPAANDEPTVTTTSTSTTTTTTTTSTTVPATTAPISESEPEPAETTTTATTTPATTTTSAPPTEIRSYDLVGGTVSVEIGDGTVRLAGASPKPGFTMEVENSGPEKVEVEFHNDDHESHFTGKFEDGRFEPSIDESSGEDDD